MGARCSVNRADFLMYMHAAINLSFNNSRKAGILSHDCEKDVCFFLSPRTGYPLGSAIVPVGDNS